MRFLSSVCSIFVFGLYYNDWWALHRKTIWSKHSFKSLQRLFQIWDYVRLQKFPFITLLENMRIEPDDINIFYHSPNLWLYEKHFFVLGIVTSERKGVDLLTWALPWLPLFHLHSHALDSIKFSIFFSSVKNIHIFLIISYSPPH